MHVAPDDIDQVIEEFKRVTRKYIILIEEGYCGRGDGDLQLNPFTFTRNYVKLLKKHGLKVIKYCEQEPILFCMVAEKVLKESCFICGVEDCNGDHPIANMWEMGSINE